MRSRTALAFMMSVAAGLGACGEDSGFTPTDAGVDCMDCPRCNDPLLGESEVSQEHRVDLLFEAAIAVDRTAAFSEAELRRSIMRLGEAFGMEVSATAPLPEITAGVVAGIQAEIGANVEGGSLAVTSGAARCFADDEEVAHAVRACEVAAACGVVEVELSDATFTCDGACVGTCFGDVVGSCIREVAGPCAGSCAGSCVLDEAAPCTGTCVGDCSGSCDGSLSSSICVGVCAGDCTGVCSTPHGATCAGTCDGLCAEEASGECDGAVDGDCAGSCSGDCEGLATASIDVLSACDAAIECQTRAALVGVARPRCVGATYDIRYVFGAAVPPEEQTAFVAEMAALERELEVVSRVAALSEFVQTGGGPGGAAGAISAGLEVASSGGFSAYGISECLAPCVAPAIQTATGLCADATAEAATVGAAASQIIGIVGI